MQWGTIFTIVKPPYLVLENESNTIYVKVADAEPRQLWCEGFRYIQDIRI